MEHFIANDQNKSLVAEMDLSDRLQNVKNMLAEASSPEYIDSLVGTIGADPLFK